MNEDRKCVLIHSSSFWPPGEITMTAPERCEDLILGSGEGGKYLAWHLAG
jgi:hypothetical protein